MPPAPIGPRAMTDYERQKKHRAAQRARLAELEAENARLNKELAQYRRLWRIAQEVIRESVGAVEMLQSRSP